MSDANRTALRVAKEATVTVLPSDPLMTPLRFNSTSLAYSPETTTSNEIDSSRQINDLSLVGFTSGGDAETELSIGNLDLLMEGLFARAWNRRPEVMNGAHWEYGTGSAAATRITAISATAVTLAATSVLSGSTVNATGTAFPVGALIKIEGFDSLGTVSFFRVTASAATSLTIAGGPTVAAPPVTTRVKMVGVEGASGDIATTITGGNALTATTLNFTTLGLSVGQWIFLPAAASTNGFANCPGGYARIRAIAAQRLDLDIVPTGFVADAGAGRSIRVFFGDFIRNGVDRFTYTIEQEFGISAVNYQYHRGQEVNSLTLSGDAKAIITASLNFQGRNASEIGPVRQSGAVSLAAPGGSVLNTSASMAVFYENGQPVQSPNFVNSFSLTLENNLRPQDAVGVLGPAGVGIGRINVTGSLSTYFGDPTLYNKVVTNAISSFTIGFRDSARLTGELWDVPSMKYSSGAPDVTGIDTDIFVPLDFQGIRNLASGRDYTISVSRFEFQA